MIADKPSPNIPRTGSTKPSSFNSAPPAVLRYFDQISEAPDAIPRLRRFILDLAVRGKLVEQDLEDEPAAELLKRIEKEKGRITETGGIRKKNPLPSLIEAEIPFQIPRNWKWSRLAEVGFVNPRNDADDGLRASFVPMPLISAKYGISNCHEVRSWGEIKSGYTHFAEGDIALAKITPCFENEKSTVFRGLTGGLGAGTTELHILRAIIINPDYVLIFLKCPHFIEGGIPRMTGTAGQKRVPTEYFAYSSFPLPPLAEQHRIVAKVAELMTLCDEMEAAKAKRERRRDRLISASLTKLTEEPTGHKEHKINLKFSVSSSCSAISRPDHIHQLRQTILNLAVRGKLVSQDPMDEPAEKLMKRNKIWWEEALLKKIIRVPRKPLKKIDQGDMPYVQPNGWTWARLGEVIYIQSGDGLIAENMIDGGIPVYGGNGVNGRHNTYNVTEPTIVIGRVGYYCGSVHVTPDKAWVTDNAFITKFCSREIFLNFLVLLLKATNLKENENATAQPVISGSKIYPIVVGIPPLAEQHRIVRRVDELMALCDELEARINTTTTTRRQFLEATFQEALSGER